MVSDARHARLDEVRYGGGEPHCSPGDDYTRDISTCDWGLKYSPFSNALVGNPFVVPDDNQIEAELAMDDIVILAHSGGRRKGGLICLD